MILIEIFGVLLLVIFIMSAIDYYHEEKSQKSQGEK